MSSSILAPDSTLARYASRAEVISDLRRSPRVDLLVIGGGIHGAAVARLAAFNGLRTALLERDDFAFHTSSRSSKMLHGGLRYLEMGDLQQVYEGLQCRATWLAIAPHLARWCGFMVPIPEGQAWYRTKLKVGLCLYDLLAGRRGKSHDWIPSAHIADSAARHIPRKLVGAYRYFDAITDDARLTLEVIVGARDEGALTLNHAEVLSVGEDDIQDTRVLWRDTVGGEEYKLRAGAVVNCAGPWAPWIGRTVGDPQRAGVRYSRGVHLIFDRPWSADALFLPLGPPGRYYWVWPHAAGAMVGTTEGECSTLEPDPQPTEQEIAEILARLERDLPGAGFDRSTLRSAFCGIRTLALDQRSRGAVSSRLSRRHRLTWEGGMLTLRGGKLTTAMWTAEEALRMVWRKAKPDRSLEPLGERPLPGAEGWLEACREFRAEAAQLPSAVIERVCATWGSRVRFLRDFSQGLELIGGTVLRGEVLLGALTEQAHDADDLLRRRLGLHYYGPIAPELRDAVAAILNGL